MELFEAIRQVALSHRHPIRNAKHPIAVALLFCHDLLHSSIFDQIYYSIRMVPSRDIFLNKPKNAHQLMFHCNQIVPLKLS